MASPKVIFNSRFTHAFNRREAGYTAKQIEGIKRKLLVNLIIIQMKRKEL